MHYILSCLEFRQVALNEETRLAIESTVSKITESQELEESLINLNASHVEEEKVVFVERKLAKLHPKLKELAKKQHFKLTDSVDASENITHAVFWTSLGSNQIETESLECLKALMSGAWILQRHCKY